MDAQDVQQNLRPNLPGALNRKSRLLNERWVEVSCQDTRGSCALQPTHYFCFCASITLSDAVVGLISK